MANTGVVHRRALKHNLISSPPFRGEVVYAIDTDEYGTLVNGVLTWKKFIDEVLSVNGKKGNVVLDKNDIGLGNVDNTSDIDKPVSAQTQLSLDQLQMNINNITKDTIGLGNVDNTSDVNKPISTATATELSKKLDKTSPSVDTLSVNGIPSSNIASKDYSYDKATVDAKLLDKANLNNVYSKLEVNNFLKVKANVGMSYTKAESGNLFELISNKAIANGYASLDSNGKVPLSQLPLMSVMGYDSYSSFPLVGAANTIYIDKFTNNLFIYDDVNEIYELVTGSSSGSGNYIRTNPMKVVVGGAGLGTIFTGTIEDALDKILYPYITPSFSSFTSTLPAIAEMGATIPAGIYTFNWSTKEAANIQPGSISISMGGVVLEENIDNIGNILIELPDIHRTTVGVTTFTISAKDTNNSTISRNLVITWTAEIRFGQSVLSVLDSSTINTLSGSRDAQVFAGTYAMGSYDYKWVCYPTFMGLVNRFKDASTNFSVAMEAPIVVTYINDSGMSVDYYCYRTTNKLGSSINIILE